MFHFYLKKTIIEELHSCW